MYKKIKDFKEWYSNLTKKNYTCVSTFFLYYKHIKSLRGHQGKYKIKEKLWSISYTRMLETKDLFISNESRNLFDDAAAPYLSKGLLGQNKSIYWI